MSTLNLDELPTFGERRAYVRRDAIASRGTHYSALDQFVDTVCTGLLIKTVYIVCLTTLTMSFIIECILINLVILPYLHESYFEEANCYLHFIEPEMPLLRCENKCSKDRSQFPCLRVHILYEWENRNHSAKLFDTIGTHEIYKKHGCVTSTCYRRTEDNRYAMDLFKMRLQSRTKFRCFASVKYKSSEALIDKFHSPQMIFHSAFWPVVIFFFSLSLLVTTFFFHRYRSWKHRSILLE
ncbi:unnamed protein product [Mesocestoides corti]|uniref:Calcium activated potassium channel subunit n=1 Tax=Mesocestoides corti TaxID=53468 RepID=A0A0R3UGY2_MESCO|nr:unnamed protein product [Mesocestoides corti]